MTTPAAMLEARLREICLALPEATEKEAWDHPTFRVREKMFAIFTDRARGDPAVVLKGEPGAQELLVGSDPDRFFVPAYVGHKGWIGIRLTDADWDEVAEYLRRSWRQVAPRRLVKAHESG